MNEERIWASPKDTKCRFWSRIASDQGSQFKVKQAAETKNSDKNVPLDKYISEPAIRTRTIPYVERAEW